MGIKLLFIIFYSFRFLCRALSTFLSAQLPSNGELRVTANAPGAAKGAAKKVHLGIVFAGCSHFSLGFLM